MDEVETVTCNFCAARGYLYFQDTMEEKECPECHGRGQWTQLISVPSDVKHIGG